MRTAGMMAAIGTGMMAPCASACPTPAVFFFVCAQRRQEKVLSGAAPGREAKDLGGRAPQPPFAPERSLPHATF